jgi:outer membrane protein TolC
MTTAPIESATVPIDLPTVLELAGERPNAIHLARARLEEAEARTQHGIASALPSLAVGSIFFRHTGRIQDVDGTFIDTSKQTLFAGVVGLLVLDPGRWTFEYLAARRREDAALADVEGARQTQAREAAEAYFELVGAQASIAIARDALEHSRAFRGVAAARERAKLGVRFDTLQAEADTGNSRRALIEAEKRFYVASARLATVLRLDPTTVLYTADREALPITLISPERPVSALVAEALDQRPDLHARELRREAADQESTAARVGPFIPTILGGLGSGTNGGFGGVGVEGSNFGDLRGRQDYFVGAGWVLHGLGLGDHAEARAAAARLQAARIEEEDLRDTIRREIVETYADARAQGAAIEAAEDELKAAEEARAISKRRLEQGTGIAVEVLAAEEARTRAATRVVEAIVAYNKAQYRLVAQLGDLPGR